MQTTLDFWRSKCQDKDKVGKFSDQIKVPTGRKESPIVKGKAGINTRRKGKNITKSQIQGQSKILSYLEPKIIPMTPSISFPNSSVDISCNTPDADSCTILMGNKTTEATKETGGETEQLKGEINLKNQFVSDDTIGQN